MRNAKIISIGAVAPDQVIDNKYFDDYLGENVSDWLETNVQIKERRWLGPDESTADLAERAALLALERANISAEEIDLIVLSTDTPEFVSPSTSSIVQDRLGAVNAGTFDINTACAGFVTALDIGSKYIQSDEQYKNILVIGAYAMSKYLNKNDKKTVTLFADGAGAVVLQTTEESDKGFLGSELLTKGQYNEWMGIYAGAAKQPVTKEVIEAGDHYLKFVHRFPKELNPEIWSSMINNLNQKIGVDSTDIDHFFITQININSIFETLDKIDVQHDKAHTIMHQYGYTGSACIPMAFNDAWEKGMVKEGDLLYFIGSGGGLAFASAAFRF